MNFSLIAAVDTALGIGKNNLLPWRLKRDLTFFNVQTRGEGNNAVIMGRTTWESLPEKSRPLKERLNIVMTRSADLTPPLEAAVVHSLDAAMEHAEKHNCNEVYVIGGAQIFAQAIHDERCTKLFLTHVEGDFSCDTFFPEFASQFVRVHQSPPYTENGITFNFSTYERRQQSREHA